MVVREAADVSLGQRTDLQGYLDKGYVSLESSDVAASLTLSYAFDDHSVGIIAAYTGDDTSSAEAYNRSLNYKQIWAKEQSLMCPRLANGNFSCPKVSTGPLSWTYYTEGNAEHWRWFVPHDLEGLVNLFSSPQDFEKKLSAFFDNHVPFHEKFKSSLPNPYYWAGNEVTMLTPYLFNMANCTYTQYWARKVLQMHFSTRPYGLPGNDDFGTMSSFVMFTSLGFYPQAGSSRFLLGSPSVDYALLDLGKYSDIGIASARVLEVIVHDNSAGKYAHVVMK